MTDDAAPRRLSVPIGEGYLHYEVEGSTVVGDDDVLLDHDDDLLAATPWAEAGFGIAPFLPDPAMTDLVTGLTDLVAGLIRTHVAPVPASFELARYHDHVRTDAAHQAVVGELFRAGIASEALPIPVATIEERISELVGCRVSTYNSSYGESRVYLRIARPGGRGDHNPPHRDVWLAPLRHGVNGYVPLAGSTPRSSLGLVPGSHRWPESDIVRTREGATLDGIAYAVPAVVGSTRELRLSRPDPAPGEVLLFSPYLVHGGAINLEPDLTRASLELRCWRV